MNDENFNMNERVCTEESRKKPGVILCRQNKQRIVICQFYFVTPKFHKVETNYILT